MCSRFRPLPVVLSLAASMPSGAAPPTSATSATPAAVRWIGTWAAAQQVPEPANALAAADMTDATLREVVHLSLGGRELRVRFSNVFGTGPLHIAAAHLARPAGAGGIDPASDTPLTFSGHPDVTIPAGADYLSDPARFDAPALSDLAITVYLDRPPRGETSHPGSRSTTYLVHGDEVSAVTLVRPRTIDHWFEISGVDVVAPAAARAVVALGDSITDGHAAITNRNTRWTDFLAGDLQAHRATRDVAVLNEGIGGNRLLNDGLGPSALARFDRDVLAQAGVRYLIVLEGINDLGTLTREGEVPKAVHQALVRRMIGAYRQIVERAHAHGIEVYGATIMPDGGNASYHPDAESEADRESVNAWIRAPGHFDAVIDFDRITRDPVAPERLAAAVDSGDHLHPGPAGYKAMADAVSLALFERRGLRNRLGVPQAGACRPATSCRRWRMPR
jgi:lysophospholipase L1-like esterase